MSDLVLLKDVAKVTAACIGVVIPASIVRDSIDPDLILLRLAASSAVAVLLYALVARIFTLPGSEAMNKDWIGNVLHKGVARFRRLRS